MKPVVLQPLACLVLAVLPSALHAQDKDAPAKKDIVNSIGMKLKLIPAGSFRMGSPADEKERSNNEGPVHKVEISKAFYMGAHTVTQAEYRKVMGTNRSYVAASGNGKDSVKGMDTSNFPVERVSWDDAKAFCAKLSALPDERKAGRVYRLPTEAEWEYACRAGTTTAFHFGTSASSKQANFNGKFPYGGADEGPYLGRTCKVGSYAPNAWGLHDMHGNVYQWCQDWYGEDYYTKGHNKDPQGPDSGERRVLRGGSWYVNGRLCRAALRIRSVPSLHLNGFGFRVVCVPAARAR